MDEALLSQVDWMAVRDRVAAGDKEAFTSVVVAFQARVRAFLAVRLADRVTVDDLAQETFLTAYGKFADFRGDSSLATWLCGIAHNHLRNHLRQRRDQPLPDAGDALERLLARSVEQAAGELRPMELVVALGACLQALDRRQRDLIDERFVQGIAVAEMCQRRGWGHSAMTMALHRLRQRLQECALRRVAIAGAAS